jgi:hypothetical protein
VYGFFFTTHGNVFYIVGFVKGMQCIMGKKNIEMLIVQ